MNNKQRNVLLAGLGVFVIYAMTAVPWGEYQTPMTARFRGDAPPQLVRINIVRKGLHDAPRGEVFRLTKSFQLEYGQMALEVGVLAAIVAGAVMWQRDEP